MNRQLWQEKPYIILVVPANNTMRAYVLRHNHDHGAKCRYATEEAALETVKDLEYAQKLWMWNQKLPLGPEPAPTERYMVILDDRFAEMRSQQA